MFYLLWNKHESVYFFFYLWYYFLGDVMKNDYLNTRKDFPVEVKKVLIIIVIVVVLIIAMYFLTTKILSKDSDNSSNKVMENAIQYNEILAG